MPSQHYALIENHSGDVWWVGYAESPEEACHLADAETDARGWDHERFEECADLASNESGYLVYSAPADFKFGDGKDRSRIAAVSAMPFVGKFKGVPRKS